ncbi:ABC transporter substrate-binding protein [Herbidospora sp. NBRC 101105]|uniref:ABC transporter substrate-binding protein n=1 Tax=Herbidospora sp. NBRC 101105 TaxID=3032195 RepID=UPI002554B66F|nr:ABC transporter substrate-binding protein [Herbidospora sp. NBRC 101105]
MGHAVTADLRGDLAGFLRRPWFWRRDQQLPVVLVTGDDGPSVVAELTAPFVDHLPTALVRDGEQGSVLALVSALAGPRGQLGRPVGGSFLPPPRFPLAQFVLWAAGQHHAPEPQSHEGYQDFRRRLRDRRRGPADASLRLVADFFIGRAALTWVPIGTIVVWLLAGPTDLVGVIPWVLGALVTVLGIGGQGLATIRGWFFYGWFRRQPVLRRNPWERLAWYALRLANAGPEEIERLAVNAMCEDLRQAYQKWRIPWPSWGRGLYCLLRLQIADPHGVTARFLRLLEDAAALTGRPVPVVVVASVPEELADPRPIAATPLADITGHVATWRREHRGRRMPVRLVIGPGDHAAHPGVPHRFRPLAHQARAWIYWAVVLAVLPGLIIGFVVVNLSDRAAHCGGLPYVDRVGGECVGVVNATEPAPDGLFAKPIADLVRRIDANNAYAVESEQYVTVALFGEYSVRQTAQDDTRFPSMVSELTAAEEYQRTLQNPLRLRVLIVNAGDNFVHGGRAADLVARLADDDPHLVGVVGLGRSVGGVEQAVDRFDAAKIPAMTTTATADDLGIVGDRPSPYFFRVGPTNFREATLSARFARRTLGADTAVIVQDGTADDTYTNNLADDFATALTAEGVEVGTPVAYGASGEGMSGAVAAACDHGADVFMYAGRAREFVGFLKSLEGSSACGAGVLKVVAGDDVIRVVADHRAEIAAMTQTEVYHVALASREMWVGVNPTGFVTSLRNGAHPDAADDNLILTYDAVDVVYRAADRAYRPGDDLPSRGDVLYRLARTSGPSAWNGSSGVIDFGHGERHDPVNKAVGVMKVEERPTPPLVRCGPLDADERPARDPLCENLPDAP